MTVLALNKRARYDYEVLEIFSAGIVLSGQEVKSAKAGQVSLKGSYVVFRAHSGKVEAYILNLYISPYRYASKIEDYKPDAVRKLLLRKREISYLLGKKEEKGLTLVPLKLYTERSLVKLEFAVARGKKRYDKRESEKRRDIKKRLKTIKQSGRL